ncbi:MAG: cytochrome C [Candidatus Wallbacteria bacterium]|nr:cytochrome C [Candidatus Wallbacteria bacterium]
MAETLETMPVHEDVGQAVTVRRQVATHPVADPAAGADDVHVWPHLVYREFLCALAVVGLLLLLALLFNAPLEDRANPSATPNPAKAAWYFLGLQELLVYFDPWFAGVVLPSLILIGLMMLPYLDLNRGDGPGQVEEPRRLAVPFFSAGLALWFGLILIGQYFRGLSWAWYWPWENWNIPKVTESFTWSFPVWLGLPVVLLYGAAGAWLPARISPRFLRRLGWTRYLIVSVFLTIAAAIPIKILLRLLLNVKYVLKTPWFNL